MFSDPYHPIVYVLHVALGFIAFFAGIVAISSRKGNQRHVLTGKVFSYLMVVVAITTLVFAVDKLLPLAVLLAVGVMYMVPSAVNAFHQDRQYAVIWDRILIVIPLLIFTFAAMQVIRSLTSAAAPLVGPMLMASTFAFLLVEDLLLFRKVERDRSFWIRRHMVRMILAFTFAAMAVLRIGIGVGLTLEQTVIYPILIAWCCIAYTYRKYGQQQDVPLGAQNKTA